MQDLEGPFLSIVTRTCRRPVMLSKMRHSLANQTCQDFEQVMLVDKVGRGVPYANRMIGLNAHRVTGEYVLVLDDDDAFATDTAIEIIKEAAKAAPDMIFFRCDHGGGLVLPRHEFNSKPATGSFGMCCFVVNSVVWKRNSEHWPKEIAGDAKWVRAVWGQLGNRVWIPEVLTMCQAVSHGKMEY